VIKWRAAIHYKNGGGIEILVVFLHVLGIVLHCLSLVHGVEIKLGVSVLDGLEVHVHGILDTVTVSESGRRPQPIMPRQ